MTNFHEFQLAALNGTPDVLGPLRGKVTLAVNVASKCGYTPQYLGLQQLYDELKDQNFAVVGFPCNQFGAQEPGSAEEIQRFCSAEFRITFPMTAKMDVNGAKRHPVYAWLTAKENGFPGDIGWNFEKFLITREGRVACRYPSGTKPTDSTFLQDLADVL